jgi:hypothetical protein
LGERVVLGTDIYELFTTALRRLVRERLLKTAVKQSSWNDQFYCGKRLNDQARLPQVKKNF